MSDDTKELGVSGEQPLKPTRRMEETKLPADSKASILPPIISVTDPMSRTIASGMAKDMSLLTHEPQPPEERIRELRKKWRRDANAYRLRAPNAGSEYEQGAIMGRAKQLEENADDLEQWLEKVLNDASSEVKSWPNWLKDKTDTSLRDSIHTALGAQHLSIDGRELDIVVSVIRSQLASIVPSDGPKHICKFCSTTSYTAWNVCPGCGAVRR